MKDPKYFLKCPIFGKFTPKLLLITFMVGRWVGSLGQVMLDFRILGHIMLDFLGDDRTGSSQTKSLQWPNYASCGQIMVEIARCEK